MRAALAALALSLAASSAGAQTPVLSPADAAMRDRLIAAAKADPRAYQIIEDLTTELGPRLAGTPEEARARAWAVRRLSALGFDTRVEDFTIPGWRRVSEHATVMGASSQPLTIASLGGSPSTPAGGLTGEVVRFAHMDALRAAADADVKGKIVFIDEPMTATMDGQGYGAAVAKRRSCAPVAAAKGAAACIVRSAGTSNRFAHVGQGARGEASAIPFASIANADAAQLTRLLERGPVRLRLELETVQWANAPSGNVIAEIRGAERPEEIVVVACHLDSWDNSPGAQDDAFGCGVVTAAAKIAVETAGPPRRTIRVIWFGAEEVGILGALAYADRHAAAMGRHILASQSDSGGAAIYGLETRLADPNSLAARTMAEALRPLRIIRSGNQATGGPDIGPMRDRGVPVFDLEQDVSAYFSVHHTPDDTLDKIDPAGVRANVAAWAIMTWIAAHKDFDFRAPPPPAPAGR